MRQKELRQKELRRLRSIGAAKDISNVDPDSITESLETIELSFGTYGMNGGLFKGRKTGELYVIIGRTSNLFRFA